MSKKIIIYLDSGANTRFLRPYKHQIDFIEFPCDSMSNKRKYTRQVDPPELQWRDMNMTWEEANFSWNSCTKSEKFEEIKHIVIQRKDALHLDTAYKAKADIFLTSDKGDIGSKKERLEAICNFKIFETKKEFEDPICNHIEDLIHQKSF